MQSDEYKAIQNKLNNKMHQLLKRKPTINNNNNKQKNIYIVNVNQFNVFKLF